ncbi:hypothetical protein ACIHFC_14200 [Streptomyces sp. NPDC052013]|uniref:hypothetical protein n=1 Tax=Streptomyces sp. NPDC052013 TaxID=3365679 RepID=UPI0037D56D48
MSWLMHGIGNMLVVLVITFGGWYLLADPRVSPFDLYPLPFNAAVFWALLFVVWSGFNLEFFGFDRLRQPLRGVVITASTAVFAVGVTYAFAVGFGHLNADFTASREGDLGYFTAALFVLFAFSTWVLAVVNWSHWPWTDLGLKQPLVGLCEIAFLMLPTVILYAVLGLPAVSRNTPGMPILGLNTLLGWYYSIVVAVVVTGLTMENWPWRKATGRGRIALFSLVGNAGLGGILYFVLLGICKLIIPTATVAELGDAIHQFPAQLGVCWVAWMIAWANAFGNKPTNLSPAVNLAARVAVTLTLGVLTFIAYYWFAAGTLLHEPVIAGDLHGNALGFVDWFALVTLLYVVGFGSYGLPKPADETAAEPKAAPRHAAAQSTH